MDRREFISNACMTCLGSGTLINFLSSCSATRYASGTLEPMGISIPAADFITSSKGKGVTRQSIIIHHDNLEFPIYLFRTNDNNYTALWMKCTHQGAELNASGDHLYCSSHGSEFDSNGKATHGPAEKNLRSFPVTLQNEKIIIELARE